MDDIEGMDLYDRMAEGTDTCHHLPVVHPAFPADLLPQGHSLYIFHYDIGRSVFLKIIPDCYDPFRVLLIQHGQDPGFPQKAAAAGGEQTLLSAGRQDLPAFPLPQSHRPEEKLLHGYPDLQLQVHSQIRDSETAPPQDPAGQIPAGQKAARFQGVFRLSPYRRIIAAEFTGAGRPGPLFHAIGTNLS